MSEQIELKIHGMDCAEEVAALKAELATKAQTAKDAYAKAQAAANALQAKVDENKALNKTFYAQLATLRNSSASLEKQREEGLARERAQQAGSAKMDAPELYSVGAPNAGAVQTAIDGLKADRTLVEPLLKAAAKAKRDELIAEAKRVAPKLDAIPDDADAPAIRKLAVTSRLGTLKRDTADAIDGAYDALLAQVKGDTAGGKDPPEPKPAAPAPTPGQVIPAPVPPPSTPAPRRDEDRADADEDKLPAMYRTDAAG